MSKNNDILGKNALLRGYLTSKPNKGTKKGVLKENKHRLLFFEGKRVLKNNDIRKCISKTFTKKLLKAANLFLG